MDWKKWRSEGIGASDAPVVMGVSPWKTRLQLWEEKTGVFIPKDTGNWATARGLELEPKARANYELTHNIAMPIAFVEHKQYPFIRASLDGYSEEKSIVLEIKCPGKADHAIAKAGSIPDKYWPQLQHQLLASGAEKVHYYSYDGDSDFALVEVIPDIAYIGKLLVELITFWDMVKQQVPPEASDMDFKQVEDNDIAIKIEKWETIKKNLEEFEVMEKEIRAEILPHLETFGRWKHKGISIYRSFRKGNIDYTKIPILDTINLEEFRKSGSSSWTFRRSKK